MLAAAVWRRQGHGVRRLCSGRLFDEHPFVQRGRLEDPTSPRFSRVVISPTHRALHEETVFALLQMRTALEMREKYRGANPVCQPSEEQTPRVEDLAADGKAFDVECRDGVFVPVGDVALEEAVARIPTVAEYHSDLMWLWGVCKVRCRCWCWSFVHFVAVVVVVVKAVAVVIGMAIVVGCCGSRVCCGTCRRGGRCNTPSSNGVLRTLGNLMRSPPSPVSRR